MEGWRKLATISRKHAGCPRFPVSVSPKPILAHTSILLFGDYQS